jgi:hypothetical protein
MAGVFICSPGSMIAASNTKSILQPFSGGL